MNCNTCEIRNCNDCHFIKIKDDMEGWRYLERNEKVIKGDKVLIQGFWEDSNNWRYGGEQGDGLTYRRKL